jgi:hypothetical protein
MTKKNRDIENIKDSKKHVMDSILFFPRSKTRTQSWIKFIALFPFLSLLLYSCSNTKFLADDEKLYTYTWFSEKGIGKIKNKPLKAYELYLVGVVKTNRPLISEMNHHLIVRANILNCNVLSA